MKEKIKCHLIEAKSSANMIRESIMAEAKKMIKESKKQ